MTGILAKLGIKKESLFIWDEIPGNDERFVEFLKQKFGIDWIKNANIQKIDEGKTIKVFTDKNFLSLKLNDGKTELKLEVDDGRISKFIAKIENGKLNIYKKEYREYSWGDLTEQLAFEPDPTERESIKQRLIEILNRNRGANQLANENFYARDLMDWIRDRGAEGDKKKAIDFFDVLKNLSNSESSYAVSCYFAAQKMINNLSESLWIQYITEVSNISKASFQKEINPQNEYDIESQSQPGREASLNGLGPFFVEK